MGNVVVVGAAGKMGTEIRKGLESSKLKFYEGVDSGSPWKSLRDLDPSQVQVVIDFSAPDSLMEVINWCKTHGVALVSGTTGIGEGERESLTDLAKVQPVIWSANMSMGVNFVAALLSHFARLEGEFDFQIEEAHHRHKKDKPSGTAILLQNKLSENLKGSLPEPLSIRGGGIFGIHKVFAMSEDEVICLEHTALNRSVFANGAVKAAEWLIGKSPGLYSMQDVLGIHAG